MSSSLESFPEMSDTPRLTGKERARARSEAWKNKQNVRFIEQLDAERECRLFPHLDEQGRAELYALYAQIEERAKQEREREVIRESHEAVVEPTVDPEEPEFQSLVLPAVTVPLTVAIQDTYAALTQRVGPSLSSWCPPEALYRFSQAQFLFYVDPVKYHSLSTACDFKNFDGIVRAIQLNAHYCNGDFEIIPEIDHLNPRCITLESIDRFRHMPVSFYEDGFPEILQYDLCLMRTMQPDRNGHPAPYSTFSDYESGLSVLPHDYSLEQLHQDGRLVAKALQYVLPSDSGEFRPRSVLTSLLPEAPYLALLNQLPIRELARRDPKGLVTAIYPESFKMTFPLDVRVLGGEGYIPLFVPTDRQREELVTMVSTGDLPSGSYSAWDDLSDDDYD